MTLCQCKHCKAQRARAKVNKMPKLRKQPKSLAGQKSLFDEEKPKKEGDG